jgi:hypothetical protein
MQVIVLLRRWLLHDFISGYDNDGMIDCIVILAERASAFCLAKENTARTGLTAITMARQAALLLLTVHGYAIPNHAVTNDFYRQALELDLRGKRKHKDAILSAMGGISRVHFSRFKALLRLADEATFARATSGLGAKLNTGATRAPRYQYDDVQLMTGTLVTTKTTMPYHARKQHRYCRRDNRDIAQPGSFGAIE